MPQHRFAAERRPEFPVDLPEALRRHLAAGPPIERIDATALIGRTDGITNPQIGYVDAFR
jgi:hypothetical protein